MKIEFHNPTNVVTKDQLEEGKYYKYEIRPDKGFCYVMMTKQVMFFGEHDKNPYVIDMKHIREDIIFKQHSGPITVTLNGDTK